MPGRSHRSEAERVFHGQTREYYMHDENPVNPTDNTPFQEVVQRRLQRRTVLAGGVAMAATDRRRGKDLPSRSRCKRN